MISPLRSIAEWASSHRPTFGVVVALLLAVQAGALYSRLTSTTPVSPAEALEEFRERQAGPAPSPAGPPQPTAVSEAGPAVPPPPAQPPGPRPAPTPAPQPAPPPPPPAPCGWECPYQGPPKAGVYEWLQCGRVEGQCTGDATEPEAAETIGQLAPVTRAFPRRGLRVVRETGPDTWTFSHAYAEEHREEFDVRGDASGIHAGRSRVDISLLGQSRSTQVRHDPEFSPFRFSSALGEVWGGHWEDLEGNSAGDYVCTVVGREELTIGDRKVRTWVVEVRIKLLGPKVRGDVTAKLWVAPELTITVQEYQEQSIVDDLGLSYRARWMITLGGLEPMR